MMDVWFSNVYEKHNIEDHDIKYLIMDRASSHVSDSIVTRMKKENIEHSFIPAGCTSFLQPLDVYINRGFKSTLRNSFEKWYSSYAFLEKNRTVGGYLRAPHYPLILQWILLAWNAVLEDSVVKSFVYCGKKSTIYLFLK